MRKSYITTNGAPCPALVNHTRASFGRQSDAMILGQSTALETMPRIWANQNPVSKKLVDCVRRALRRERLRRGLTLPS